MKKYVVDISIDTKTCGHNTFCNDEKLRKLLIENKEKYRINKLFIVREEYNNILFTCLEEFYETSKKELGVFWHFQLNFNKRFFRIYSDDVKFIAKLKLISEVVNHVNPPTI